MGKDPFEDPELQALRASMRPTASPVRWGRVLTGALVVACATFAFAYYLPLRRAHESLTLHFAELKSKVDSASRAAEESRAQAKALGEKTQTLQTELDAAEQREKTSGDASRGVASALESKLQKTIASDQAAVATAGSQAVASLSLAFLLTRGKLEVSAPGKLALCSVSGATSSALRVVAIAGKKDIPPALAPKLKTPLEYNLAVAELVTQTLADQCKTPSAKLSAAGIAAADPAPTAKLDGKKLSGARVELWFESAP